MEYVKSCIFVAVLLVVLCNPGTCNVSVFLSSNLIEGNRAYDRQQVTFRCVIIGIDTILTWRSDGYIGVEGDVLHLASADQPGQTASNSRNPTTVATLISTTRSGGVTTTISELQLTASSQVLNSTVSCGVNSHGPFNTTFFWVINPDVMVMHNLIEGNRAYDGQRVTLRCVIIGIDTVLTWRSDGYIGIRGDVLQLASTDQPGHSASNSRNPTTVATLISTTRSGGVTTTISELQLTASSQILNSTISCGVNSRGPFNTTFFQVTAPDVIIMHNLAGGNRAYNGQRITFRCIITGLDTVLTWRSDDYIGIEGDILQLASADQPGQTASNSRNPTTVATLISTTRSGGVTTTISELQLTATSQFPISSISCENNGGGPVGTIVFQTLFELIATTSVILDITSDRSGDDSTDPTLDADEFRNDMRPIVYGSIGAAAAVTIILIVGILVILLTYMHRVKSRKRSIHADIVDSVDEKGDGSEIAASESTSSSYVESDPPT